MPIATYIAPNKVPKAQVDPIVIIIQAKPAAVLRNKHKYLTLTPAEINKIPKSTFKCVGMQFTDNSDPSHTTTGVVTSIMRHKKSTKLVLKYWNHHIEDNEANNASAF